MKKSAINILNSLYPNKKAFDYQIAWASDESKYKLSVKARQIGITYTEAVDKFIHCLLWKENEAEPLPPVIIFASPSQRQSTRLMEYIQRARTRFEKIYEENIVFKKEREDHLIFPNQAEIFSLPNSPRTIEGIDATQGVIDEASNFEGREDEEVYQALMGSLGAKGGGITIFGRPRGRRGLFWKLFDPYGEFASKFSIHQFPWTVRAAHDKVYKKTVLDQKERMTAISFSEQYECQFIDESIVVFPYTLLDRQKKEIKVWGLDEKFESQFPLYIGIDFAKKHDQTAITLVEHGDINTNVRFQVVTRDRYDEQLLYIKQVIKYFNPVKVLVDETGLGLPMLDSLKADFDNKVEGVLFSSSVKEKLVLNTKNLLDEGRLQLPKDSEYSDLIEQLHGIEKAVSEQGKVKYTGKRSETDWLDDRAWSLFLACSQLGEGNFEFHISQPKKQDYMSTRDRWIRDIDE